MNSIKERMNPEHADSIRSPATRERRAVVEMYAGRQLMPDEAMLPMPPHNMARIPWYSFQDYRLWLDRLPVLLRRLKLRF